MWIKAVLYIKEAPVLMGKMKWMEQGTRFPLQEVAAVVYQEVKALSTKSLLRS